LEVALYLVGGTNRSCVGVCSGRAQRAPLPEQVPALVELDFDRLQSLELRCMIAGALGGVPSQAVFLADKASDDVVDGLIGGHGISRGLRIRLVVR
jgi:hypothetical protein